VIEVPALVARPGLRHRFFGRRGGVSGGVYESLNCGLGVGDDPDHVWINRARCAERLGTAPDRLCTARQTHGTAVVRVGEPWPDGALPEADGLVTDRRGLVIGVLTADCAPVLLADPEAGVIGAAHAGWRGAVAGVVEATVAAMAGLGAEPDRIVAAVGPCIAQESYEVGPELLRRFAREDPGSEAHFVPQDGRDRLLLDLPGYVLRRLAAAGVGRRAALRIDTFRERERLFSCRRTARHGGGRFGLQLSAIGLA
jgi:polyphenol oxidase